MRKTKIICTMGPACHSEEILEKMVGSGMNVARLNFSHGSHEEHAERIRMIHSVRERLGVPLAIMLDTKGPEIRLRDFQGGSAVLQDGAGFILTTDEILGDETRASITYRNLPEELSGGESILIDDGKLELRVDSCGGTEVRCTVVHGGVVSNKKSINLPNSRLKLPYLSEQDKSDLLFGISQDVDYIAASFTRSKEDVIALRKFINYNGGHGIRIIAKIENIEGVENFNEILRCADGIMVARGDMGVEIDYERLPGLQKRFIRRCYQAGKVVITATQMLDSMISCAHPTRAEITDVANAVFDGTSAIMLSGETAAGKYPVEAVKVMATIAEQAEKDAFEMQAYRDIRYDVELSDNTNAVCDAACTMARDIRAKAIIALTKYGHTARRMSKFRPFQPVVAATHVRKTYHQLGMCWGVYPVMARDQNTSDELLLHAVDCARQIDVVEDGDLVVIAAGVPLDTPGSTNLLKVEVVGSRK